MMVRVVTWFGLVLLSWKHVEWATALALIMIMDILWNILDIMRGKKI